MVRFMLYLKTEPQELLVEQISGTGERNQSSMIARNGPIVVYAYNGGLLGNKKKGSTDTQKTRINLTDIMLSKRSQAHKYYTLSDSIYVQF